MKGLKENRREFLFRLGVLGVIPPAFASCSYSQAKAETILKKIKSNAARPTRDNWDGAFDAPAEVSWKTSLAKETDAGERILISGTVYEKNGVTPAPNVLIYAYHTDAQGFYSKGNGDEHRHGRHRGWMLTDAQGRYEFSSIKPAQYPALDTPAHIHFTLTGLNFKEDWIDDIWFEGDDLITPEIKKKALTGKGGFNSVLNLKPNAEGILVGRRDIKLNF